MALKRAVHRPKPFDILLHEWQKVNKPNLFGEESKPVQPRVGNGNEAYVEASNRKKSGEKKKKKVGNGVIMLGEMEEEGEEEDSDMIDSEEEMEMVMRGLAKGPPARPLYEAGSNASMFIARNSKLGALRGTLGGIFAKKESRVQ